MHIDPFCVYNADMINPHQSRFKCQVRTGLKSQLWLHCTYCSPLPAVGHCHPRVTEAGAKQMAKLADVHDPQITEKYTQHLLSTFPENMGHVFYVHSGYVSVCGEYIVCATCLFLQNNLLTCTSS